MIRRKTIPLSADEIELLKHLYLEFCYPSDQYKRRPRELARFVRRWNDLADRHDDAGEVLHFIVTKRKNDQWVRFDGAHKKLASMPDDFLSDKEWQALREAYVEVVVSRNIGSDNLAFDRGLAKEIGLAFARRTGRGIHAPLLFAALEAKRKRGEWITLPGRTDHGKGYDDFDEVANG